MDTTGMPDITIPEGPTRATRKNPQMALFYSAPKTGKTTVCAQLPDSLIMECDPEGADFVDARHVDVRSAKDMLLLLGNLQKRRTEGKPACRRLVVDHMGWVEDWALDLALKEYVKTPLGKSFTGTSILELPNGAGYGRLRTKIQDVLWEMTLAAPEVVLLAHNRDKMILKNQGEVSATDIDLMGKVRNITCGLCSAVGFMYREGNLLKVTFKTGEMVNCGSRYAHLSGKTFTLSTLQPDGTVKADWSPIYLPD